MKIIREEIRQRAFDGKWERLGLVPDYDNIYTYSTESGAKVNLIPEKWITLKVYDYMMEIA